MRCEGKAPKMRVYRIIERLRLDFGWRPVVQSPHFGPNTCSKQFKFR